MSAVAIIGAGMAGLAAAHALAQQGIRSVIYEKSRGVGGRAATRTAVNCLFDHGAQYVKAPTPDLTALMRASGAVDLRQPVWTFDAAGQVAEGDPQQNAAPKWTWPTGMTALGKYLAADLDVRLHMQVARLVAHPQGYILYDSEGYELTRTPVVLLTPPAPQTARILKASTLDGDLRDRLLAALDQASYRRILAVTLAYGRRPDVPWYALVNTDRQHAISWLACEHAKPGRAPDDMALLVVHLAHDASGVHWETSPKGLYGTGGVPLLPWLPDLHAQVQTLVGVDMGAPRWAYVQRWGLALPNSGVDEAALNGTASGLFFAGDGTAGQGRVHLALEQGWRVAEAIAARLHA